jgi:hypothetical protein
VLAILLVSIFIASLSDLQRMSAQRIFFVFWLLIIAVVLIYDIYMAMESEEWLILAVKWGLISLFAILSNSVIGIYFKLARADIAACAAAACILTPVLIILFFILLKILDFMMRPVLRLFGKDNAYPFMPVVLVGLLGTLAISIWIIPWLLGTGILGWIL